MALQKEALWQMYTEVAMYEYKVTTPTLPPPEKRTNSGSSKMDLQEMTWWMNHMAEQGWEFVSYGATFWSGITPQEWWVFRREKIEEASGESE